jgi:hypothetical protein
MKIIIKYLFFCILLLLLEISCTKLVTIAPPVNSITTSEAFKDSANASSAIMGIYSSMINGPLTLMNGALSVHLGESADELTPFYSANDKYYSNTLSSDFEDLYYSFWSPSYTTIYQTNASIEGLQASQGLSLSAKNRFIGEAQFLRSLCYFYLVNLYGDVPFITTSDYHSNTLAFRTSKAIIYQQIINNLIDAQKLLSPDYSISGNDRIRANMWAAKALLSRVYLYSSKYDSAEIQATSIIGNANLFQLCTDLNSVFLTNAAGNNEAILQWQINAQGSYYNATPEGYAFVPHSSPDNYPPYYISDQLLNSFEKNDKRKIAWIDSTIYGSPSITYYFPYKYKIGLAEASPNGTLSEYTMVLRLAEQYLIRAEARAHQNINLSGAIDDLNIIRERAGLPDLSLSLNQTQVLSAVAQERRIELFAEWGHRWFDLKRTGQIDSVMTVATPLKGQGSKWQSYQQLFPITFGELKYDPNLTQNVGY